MNLAKSACGLTHPIITARSRSNLFSSRSFRSKYSSISSPAYFFRSASSQEAFEVSIPDISFLVAFLSWCLSADIVAKLAQRFVFFGSCSFAPPDLAFKETWEISLNTSREERVRKSESVGILIREWKDFQSASIWGSVEIRASVAVRTFSTSAIFGRFRGLTLRKE